MGKVRQGEGKWNHAVGSVYGTRFLHPIMVEEIFEAFIQQMTHRYLQGLGDFLDVAQARVALSSFNAADVGAV